MQLYSLHATGTWWFNLEQHAAWMELSRAIRALNNLGFDTPYKLRQEMLTHDDWMARLNVKPERSKAEATLVEVFEWFCMAMAVPRPIRKTTRAGETAVVYRLADYRIAALI